MAGFLNRKIYTSNIYVWVGIFFNFQRFMGHNVIIITSGSEPIQKHIHINLCQFEKNVHCLLGTKKKWATTTVTIDLHIIQTFRIFCVQYLFYYRTQSAILPSLA